MSLVCHVSAVKVICGIIPSHLSLLHYDGASQCNAHTPAAAAAQRPPPRACSDTTYTTAVAGLYYWHSCKANFFSTYTIASGAHRVPVGSVERSFASGGTALGLSIAALTKQASGQENSITVVVQVFRSSLLAFFVNAECRWRHSFPYIHTVTSGYISGLITTRCAPFVMFYMIFL